MVLVATLFAASAQIMMKYAASHAMPPFEPARLGTWIPFAMALTKNLPLIAGYFFSAGNALMLILALRDGELSILYPIISLSYVWVNLLSVWIFHDQENFWKITGMTLIISGVALLGKASQPSS